MARRHERAPLREHELRERIGELNDVAEGREFTDDERSEWNTLNTQLEEYRIRRQRVEELARTGRNSESEASTDGLTVTSYRQDLPQYLSQTRSHALGTLERHVDALTAGAQKTLETFIEDDVTGTAGGQNSRYLTAVGAPGYRSAFGKLLCEPTSAHLRWSPAEHAAMQGANRELEHMRALGISGTGNYAVPLELDPTIVLTSNGALNPIRQIARVQQTTVNTVDFVTSTGVTAAFGAEATEASDNSPTLVQPSANVEKAFAFVPVSIELTQDWVSLTSELAVLFSDARDVLESQKFATGLGHGSHEPQGLISAGGATAVVTTGSTATIGVSDVYSLIEALGYRFRPNARIVGNPTVWDRVYRLVASADATNAPLMTGGRGGDLLGIPKAESSGWTSATTTGSTVLTYGDYSHFRIVDRLGSQVEIINHLFGASNRYPTGQRGVYFYWRCTSLPLDTSAFVSLKVL
jgi:HK97 family phage major capsid protein